MIETSTASLVADIPEWLRQRAASKGLGDRFEAVYIRQDGEWLHFAVRMDAPEMPLFRRAAVLRELEDAWTDQHPGAKLLLVPLAG